MCRNDAKAVAEKKPKVVAADEAANESESETEPVDTEKKSYLAKVRSRLFTKEDEVHFHKIFGGLALLNFFYRYFYVYPTTGSLGYEHVSLLNDVTTFIHIMLSSSSLIFHVIKRRMPRKPLIIYEEYRLHAILFTIRAAIPYVLMRFNVLDMYPVVILSVHLMVDYVTSIYGTPGVTAVRVRGKSKKGFVRAIRYFFSFYQIVALGAHLSNRDLPNMGWNALIAIQSSAFLMTLHRKALIDWYVYTFWYGLALFLSYLVMLRTQAWFFLPMCALAFGVRIMGVSKYVIWGTFYTLVHHNDKVMELLESVNLGPSTIQAFIPGF